MVGKPLHYPAPVSRAYEQKLAALIRRMRKEYEREVKRLYATLGTPTVDGATMDASLASQARIVLNRLGERWARAFSRASKEIVDGFISRLDKFAKRDVERSLEQLSGGLTIKTPQWPGALEDKLKASITENVALIRSIPQQYHERLEGVVMRSIQSGEQGSAHVYREIMKTGTVTESRARLIATDQTRKLTTALNVERMKAAGVRRWRWLHSGGSAEPRRLHLELSGQEFSYDDPPPIIDERTGERGFPGQLINCKCVLVPVIDFSEEAD